RQLTVAAEELQADPPGAVVVWGGPRLFAAGADIGEMMPDGETILSVRAAKAISDGFRAAYDAVAAIPRLTVAAICGYALGGGCGLEGELFGEVFMTSDAATGIRSFLASGPGRARFSGR